MQLGLVVGTTTATIQHPSLRGMKLLIVQPRTADGKSPDGDPLIAVDAVGAGTDEMVMISSDRSSAKDLLGTDATPVRWTVIGIRD